MRYSATVNGNINQSSNYSVYGEKKPLKMTKRTYFAVTHTHTPLYNEFLWFPGNPSTATSLAT